MSKPESSTDADAKGAIQTASSHNLDLEKELSCSICTEILYQPLTLLDCLHTFCGSCLKEWFSWQVKGDGEREANPYTCPQCRSPVRDTRPNATVTTLLDMFLQANPSKARTESEKEDVARKYKPGDTVIERVVETAAEDDERRLLQQVRELSLREARQQRRQARAQAQAQAREDRSRRRSREPQAVRGTSPHRAARQELERQLRQHRGLRPGQSLRSLEHQASLRTLLSSRNNAAVSQAVQHDIIRQITEEGLLDGIDMSHLDASDELMISELIAAAYLERRNRSRTPARQDPANGHDTRQASRLLEPASAPRSRSAAETSSDEVRNGRRHRRQVSAEPPRTDTTEPRPVENTTEPTLRRTTRLSSPPTMDTTQSLVAAPKITCANCARPKIQHQTHHVCFKCPWKDTAPYSLCHRCYLSGAGCKHWFGFGQAADIRFQSTGQTQERPHRLRAQRYVLSVENADLSRLERGAFCASCDKECASTCFWQCDECNDGEWGFCSSCVSTGRLCTHPLTPMGKDGTTDSHTDPARHLTPLILRTTCDHCHEQIEPANARYHCPSCPNGDYDICSPCYNSLIDSGTISSADGVGGWRKCPNGHRMQIIGFESRNNVQRRVIVANVVGGWRVPEAETAGRGPDRLQSSNNPDAGFHWHDASSGLWRQRRNEDGEQTNDSASGKSMVARWTRLPDDGVDDELSFPKRAEIQEVIEVNDNWSWGVYCRRMGVFPSAFCRLV